jgi:hypothetical protein
VAESGAADDPPLVPCAAGADDVGAGTSGTTGRGGVEAAPKKSIDPTTAAPPDEEDEDGAGGAWKGAKGLPAAVVWAAGTAGLEFVGIAAKRSKEAADATAGPAAAGRGATKPPKISGAGEEEDAACCGAA